MLNATHTLSCGIAFLAGFETVRDAMNTPITADFISELMMEEIAPSIPNKEAVLKAKDFGLKVLERFRNPFIQHHWISITMNYSQKMRTRAIPLLLNYSEQFNQLPENFSSCFAAYLLFMKVTHQKEGHYYGTKAGVEYLINDEKAGSFQNLWMNFDVDSIVNIVLQDIDLWDTDLTQVSGFEAEVLEKLKLMMADGMMAVLQTKKVLQYK